MYEVNPFLSPVVLDFLHVNEHSFNFFCYKIFLACLALVVFTFTEYVPTGK